MTTTEIRDEIIRLKKLPQSPYIKMQIQKLQQLSDKRDGI